MYTTSKIGDSKMNVNELIKKYELQILEQNGKRGVHACKNPTDTDKRDIISNMEAILVELDRRESEKNHAYEEREKKINAIEGLQEIRNAIDEIDCYKFEFVELILMKGFERKNQLFSLCGLNCGLCPMLLGNYCGGCGNGNQSCKIAKCSLAHGEIEYCYECKQYPCEKYQHIDKYDSFITHRRRNADLERAQSMGIEQYNAEQQEKIQILSHLLSNYNDGRRKNFFCVAVNLLELSELQEALKQIQSNDELSALPFKAQCSYVVEVLQKIADKKNIKLKLIKKK